MPEYRYLLISLFCAALISLPFTSSHGINYPADNELPAANIIPKISVATEQSIFWPNYVGVHNQNNIGLAVNCFGQLGYRFMQVSNIDPETGKLPPSFIFPANSNKEYLFAGGFWIGGIVEGDTIVSVGAAGYEYVAPEFYPGDAARGSVNLLSGVADRQFIATYSDSAITSYTDPRFDGLDVTERTYAWVTEPYKDFIIYELNIKNMTGLPIMDTWLGYYIDCDVYVNTSASPNFGYADDITGLRRQSGIAYIMDNDGDPLTDGEYAWSDNASIRGIFGIKLLDMYPASTDTSYNWWVRGPTGEIDWGPRYIGDTSIPLYEFTDGNHGQPGSDRDRYHMLSNSEIDYDMIWTSFMQDDSNWMPMPENSGTPVDYGTDARFIYSFGEIDLMPGDSIVFVFALIGGENVHVEPDDYYNYHSLTLPERYYYRLDFNDLESNAFAAQELYESGYQLAPPIGPVQDVRIVECGDNIVRLNWLEREHPDLVGYNVYYAPVPDSQIFFADTVLGPRDTTQMILHNVDSAITGTEYVIDDLVDGQMYFISVATVTTTGNGIKSPPLYVTFGFPDPPQTGAAKEYIKTGNTVALSWTPANDDIDHYNIYRRSGYIEYSKSYGPTISVYPVLHNTPYDSMAAYVENGDTTILYYFKMEPYTSVPAPDTTFIDNAGNDELYYFITAVDTLGQESELSSPIHVLIRGQVTKDLLIYLPNSGKSSNVQNIDSVIALYDRALAGLELDYDYFFVSDSTGLNGCEDYICMGWTTMAPYRTIIFDDNQRDASLYQNVYGSFTDVLTDYINIGGNLLYFGNLLRNYTGLYIDTQMITYNPGMFEYDILHIDSLYMTGLSLYTNGLIAGSDTIGGLILAEPVNDSFPPLEIDTNFYWWESTLFPGFIWPPPTPPMTGCLYPRSPADPIYLYRSLYPETSFFEGLPCGVKYSSGNGDVYTFTMHPYYFHSNGIRTLLNNIIEQTPVSADQEDNLLPDDYTLYQNFPNPFNPGTAIKFNLPRASDVRLDIYNILGRKVKTLVSGPVEPGISQVIWDATDYSGRDVASGIYFYRIEANDFVSSKKMLLLK